MTTDLVVGYTSGSQVARLVTEAWGERNLFCAACDSPTILPTPPNTKAVDFVCPECSAGYQLKAGRQLNARRVPDGAYSAMMAAVQGDSVPKLLILQYTSGWAVQNLTLIPSFAFTASAIEKRKPLGPMARRAGWTGCNILLSAIPESAKLRIVDTGAITAISDVRGSYRDLQPLAAIAPAMRGWTLDVLGIVQSFKEKAFDLADVYAFDHRLSVLHPGNRNVRPKIRQQLQVLRDIGFISFLGGGKYLLTNHDDYGRCRVR
jgi:type II restriction enzyme